MSTTNNPTLFTYCMPIDDGAAPNPYWGICTLVICKPVIRRVANVGDWVVGIGSKNSPIGDISKSVVYAMKITDKISMKEYDSYCKENYPNKIPDWEKKDFKKKVGDCIYDYSIGLDPQLRKAVHSEKNKARDLGGMFALISDHFYYFGDNPLELPKKLWSIRKENQGHKSKSNDPFVSDFISWIESNGELNCLKGEPQYKKKLLEPLKTPCDASLKRLEEAEEDEKIGIKYC